MNEGETANIRDVRKIAQGTGMLIRHSLLSIAQHEGFSLEQLVQKGVICADVEYGGEGYAFLPLNPPFIVLGEPPAYVVSREKEISNALQAFLDSRVTIRRSYATDLIDESMKNGIAKAGLVTWLNVFPSWIDDGGESLRYFAERASEILLP